MTSTVVDAASLHVKICCIASIAEAELALACGATFLGLVSAMPSGPGVITDDTITRVRDWIAEQATTVLLTSRATASGISAQLKVHRPHVIQLCDDVPLNELEQLRIAHPETMLMQVIHVRSEASVAEAQRATPYVDALLLDSGNPAAAVKELGGTGRVHDWNLSRAIRDSTEKPVFLAGGLRAENVAAAVAAVRPYGVDVCSGVRENGALVKGRLTEFVGNARK